jgi:multidrug efflux system membrane fusion protein
MMRQVVMPATSRRRNIPTLASLAAAAVLVLSGCSGGSSAGAQPAAGGRGGGGAGAPVAIIAAPVVAKPMPVRVKSVGNVEASSTVEVRAQVTGELQSVAFEEGRDVAAGQLLFTIDPRTFEATVKQAEAQLARSKAQAVNLEAQKARAENLSKSGLVSRAELDTATSAMAAMQATIAADTAALENARLQLQRTKIEAPVSGRTGALLVNRGAIIRANDTTPLVVINQMSPVFVSFAVPARLLPQLREASTKGALEAEAVPSGSADRPSAGRVTFIDNAVDRATDTIRLKATFANDTRRLWPGAFVDVSLQLAVDTHALVVPSAAVQPSQQGTFVYVVKADQTVESRPVKVLRIEGPETVLDNGVKAGEMVVTDGHLRLVPGSRVTVKRADESEKRP